MQRNCGLPSGTLHTYEWTADDIDYVKSELPDGVSFARLDSRTPDASTFQVVVESGQTAARLLKTTAKVEGKMHAAGIPVDEITVQAGYAGSTGPCVLLRVVIDAE